ncbi:MAG TPA: peptidase MA family metallohydrolase [Ktedonobacteraceae bacterium]|nr:peptidase MA family metallohydrolase [Ktedonobacteraceae bacterium]
MCLRSLHFLRLVLLPLCVLYLVPTTFSATVHAATHTIQVSSQTDSVAFPKAIDFRLSAVDTGSNIVQAVISIASDDPTNSIPNASHNVIFRQAKMIAIDYRDDISGNNFITPGTPMQYYWILQDSAGNTYTGATQHFMLLDSRFSWQHMTQGQVTVNWYNRPQSFDQTLLADASGDITRIGGVLGGGLLHPINLWVYETPDDFHGALSPTSYEWVGGIAFPSLSEAFISVAGPSDTTLIRDMPHELTHLVFHQLTAQGILAPTWFDEGLAVYNQQYHEPEMTARLDEALASHTLLRLSNISFNFPADADSAYLAYAQSWNLISYMYNTFGQPKMARLIQLMNNANSDFSDDMTKAIGEDTLHLENQWRVFLHQSSVLTPADQPTATTQPLTVPPDQLPSTVNGTEPFFVSVGILLIVAPLLMIVFIVMSQRRKRQQALVAQDAQRILNMTFGQPASFHNQSALPPSSWTNGTRFTYSPPFPPSPPQATPGNNNAQNTIQYPDFPAYKEYPQQGQQKQAPQE